MGIFVVEMEDEKEHISESESMAGEGCALSSAGYSHYRELYSHGVHALGVVHRYDRRFFVKSLREPYGSMQLYRLRLRKEFSMLLGISHPGIVRVYDLVEIPGVGLSILMEYVEGITLRRWLEGKPSRARRRRVADELVRALEAVHAVGAVHRDLKPDNIMVTPCGEVRIIDFGFCDSGEYAVLKQPCGTPAYAAPEQMKPDYQPDPRCDVWALGLILKEINAGMRLTVKRCLRRDAALRPASAAEVRRFAERMRRLACMAIGAGCLLTALGAGWLLLRPSRPAAPLLADAVDTAAVQPANPPAGSAAEDEVLEPVSAVDTHEAPYTGASVPAKTAADSTAKKRLLLVEKANDELTRKARGVVAALEAIKADGALSREKKIERCAVLMGELAECYRGVCTDVADVRDESGRPLLEGDELSLDRLAGGRIYRRAEALRDSIFAL